MPPNDNDAAIGRTMPPSDPHDRAGLLLVESLIHGLCEKAVLTTGEAIAIVDRAAEVQSETAEQSDGPAAPMWRSHATLKTIAGSRRTDGDRSG